ncbi:hypothetical protein [Methyloglobulus sp.]|uniref:hypothetical protein n=1 Tax=Methyloglobulus sp. TaxID=2518622 RepID=UPI0032B70B22
MQICNYFKKIENNETFNFDAFVKLLNEQGIDSEEILRIFSVNKIKKNSYQVNIINAESFYKLSARFPEYPISDRISAAEAGNSHRHPVSKAILILWPYQSEHPVVVLNSTDRINAPVKLSQNLLIIENQENFVRREAMLNFLMKEIPGFNDDQLDVVFASGNAITNKLNKAFFNHYSRIDCLLDLDIGGLEIFQSIDRLTQHPALNFLLPNCAESLLSKHGMLLKDHHLPRLRRLAENCPKLERPFNLIAKTRKMLEQEIYLRD